MLSIFVLVGIILLCAGVLFLSCLLVITHIVWQEQRKNTQPITMNLVVRRTTRPFAIILATAPALVAVKLLQENNVIASFTAETTITIITLTAVLICLVVITKGKPNQGNRESKAPRHN